jgi:transcriptional regulator with XRE-family HTH domain
MDTKLRWSLPGGKLTRTRGSESIGSIAEGEGHGSGGLGLTMRDIETASEWIARSRHNEEHLVSISRLSDFETKGVIPSIYRLYSLAVIYRRDLREILLWYGVSLEVQVSDLEISAPPKSHLSNALANMSTVQMPVRMDPGFDPRKTLNFGRMAKVDFTYGYIGTEDLAMYPILPPGSFIQVDESRNKQIPRTAPVLVLWMRKCQMHRMFSQPSARGSGAPGHASHSLDYSSGKFAQQKSGC